MPVGRILRLLPDAGIGFVAQDGEPTELYFHRTAVVAGSLDQLSEGQVVTFEVTNDPRDPDRQCAVNLKLLDAKHPR